MSKEHTKINAQGGGAANSIGVYARKIVVTLKTVGLKSILDLNRMIDQKVQI